MLEVEDRRSGTHDARREPASVVTDQEQRATGAQQAQSVPTQRERIVDVLDGLKTTDQSQAVRRKIRAAERRVPDERADLGLGGGDRRGRGLDTDHLREAVRLQLRQERAV